MARSRAPVGAEGIYDALGAALRRARGGRTQTEVAVAAGINDQTTLSDYELARSRVALDVAARIAKVCGTDLGAILVDAGLVQSSQVPTETDTESAIRSDPTLDADGREVVLNVYDYCQRASIVTRPEGMTREQLAEASRVQSAKHRAWVESLGHPPTQADLEERARELAAEKEPR